MGGVKRNTDWGVKGVRIFYSLLILCAFEASEAPRPPFIPFPATPRVVSVRDRDTAAFLGDAMRRRSIGADSTHANRRARALDSIRAPVF